MKKIVGTSKSRVGSNGYAVFDGSSGSEMLAEEFFMKQLGLERKRTERSGRRFVLMLLDHRKLVRGGSKEGAVERIVSALAQSIRETDIKGWYAESVIGVIFTEIGSADGAQVAKALLNKVTTAVCRTLAIEDMNEISISFHIYPEDWEDGGPGDPTGSRLYPDLVQSLELRRASHVLKRSIDVFGSLLALVLSLPLFFIIAAAIRLTSKGPVFFRQTRLGQYGKKFTFFKFRSMYVATDHTIHEQFVADYIAGTLPAEGEDNHRPVYKITSDPRITSVGQFLRRTSLDEVPQFFNVLRGDMSLVGPRPPIPYEFARHGVWHKRRLLAVKPGITGLWQVAGRSKVPFDEMVRLDLEYAKSWSLWMDIKILFRTPLAVLNSDGAY
ncbi:MAG: sugar transferase [Terriglobia bacterium]|jgi:lipopolysaccharide/colanic/teichoic acid biosynthesis glycosyltransferase